MYVSPRSNIRLVIRKKSVEYMVFFLSFAVVVSSFCWFIYALLGMAQFIGTATGVILGLVVVQLILYFIYCLNKITFATDESIQMEKWHNNNVKWHNNNVKSYHDGKQSNFHENNQHSNQAELVAVSNLTKKNDKS
ncbi:putative dihydrofolate reductase-like [Capsicum annuum]|uniref:Uncharacterized protein n=1 Tax=Capsicum annuum TaxID=4072 RepID=A0A2G2Z1E3_CAPAN|nr:putative dihydrofolate reductase-like [Capsicum annuum]KAF3621466.1 putative dihydrofolate reductase-like [Capsicum annuum]PHT75809.1 hypothetical protein T459_19331 [Capsicum annuum]